MKNMGYRFALQWLVSNDDTEFLKSEEKIPSVSACLIADLFSVSVEKVMNDLVRVAERSA